MDAGGSVTLIFYRVGEKWWKEPLLNLISAACQGSSFTHVEIAIGDAAGSRGEMSNVVRIFNDNVGVEIASRTGRNPQFSYVQLGCSKAAENTMLRYARSVVGRPFSNAGMARSILFPRQTDDTSFFCAELVAAVLKKGGLLSSESNPGSATPISLYKTYSPRAAAAANPFLLRDMTTVSALKGLSLGRVLPDADRERLLPRNAQQPSIALPQTISFPLHTVQRGNFRVTSQRQPVQSYGVGSVSGIQLSLSSLDMRNNRC